MDYSDTYSTSHPLHWLLPMAVRRNFIFVGSAGNFGTSTPPVPPGQIIPAAYMQPGSIGQDSLIVVDSHRDVYDGTRGRYIRKLSPFSSHYDYVTLSAPGEQIYHAWKDGTWTIRSGTSQSAAITSGVLASLLTRADLQHQLEGDEPMAVKAKRLLLSIANYASETFDDVKAISMYDYVSCSDPLANSAKEEPGDLDLARNGSASAAEQTKHARDLDPQWQEGPLRVNGQVLIRAVSNDSSGSSYILGLSSSCYY
jgi:hypothetical protein